MWANWSKRNTTGNEVRLELWKRLTLENTLTNQNMFKKMRPIKFSETLRYNRTIQSRPDDKTVLTYNKKELIISWILTFQLNPERK